MAASVDQSLLHSLIVESCLLLGATEDEASGMLHRSFYLLLMLPISAFFGSHAGLAAETPDYGKAAREIGDFFLATARKDGKGICWAQYEGSGPAAAGEKLHFPVSLYTGLSGTGFFLLNLYKYTGERKYLDAAAGACEHLIAIEQDAGKGGSSWNATSDRNGREVQDGERSGLYSGNAGIGLFLEYVRLETKNKKFREASDRAFRAIQNDARKEGNGLHWEYSFMDVIGGEAGIGLALLEKHSLTRSKEWLETGLASARWLVSGIERDGRNARWKTFGGYDPNFSHGVSGIAFMLEAAARAGLDCGTDARAAAFWVQNCAVACEGGGLVWKYYSEPPPEGKPNWVMNAWCHGAPGTVRLFVLRHALHKDRAALDIASKGCVSIAVEAKLDADKPFFNNPTLCCGSAGCVEAFSMVYAASGEDRMLGYAKKAADAILADLHADGSWRAYAEYATEDKEKKNPYYPTGFMQGNAGLGYALLQLDAAINKSGGKLIYLPDHPFAHATKK